MAEIVRLDKKARHNMLSAKKKKTKKTKKKTMLETHIEKVLSEWWSKYLQNSVPL